MAATTDIEQEQKWVTAARGGSMNAFSALVALYEERSIRMAYSLLGNWEDARDNAQEAFVKAYQALPKFKAESRFSTWFYRILVNQCRDFQRKQNVRRHLAASAPQPEGEEEQGLEEKIPSRSPSPLSELMNREIETRVRAGLQELPERQRVVFTLRYFEGLTLQEIAEALNITEGAVKANLWQAGEKMKPRLAAYVESRGAGS